MNVWEIFHQFGYTVVAIKAQSRGLDCRDLLILTAALATQRIHGSPGLAEPVQFLETGNVFGGVWPASTISINTLSFSSDPIALPSMRRIFASVIGLELTNTRP